MNAVDAPQMDAIKAIILLLQPVVLVVLGDDDSLFASSL